MSSGPNALPPVPLMPEEERRYIHVVRDHRPEPGKTHCRICKTADPCNERWHAEYWLTMSGTDPTRWR